MQADKVHLISKEKGDQGREFLEGNKNMLTEMNIQVIVGLVESIHELPTLLRKIKKIIKEENKDNYIFINISSGSTRSL